MASRIVRPAMAASRYRPPPLVHWHHPTSARRAHENDTSRVHRLPLAPDEECMDSPAPVVSRYRLGSGISRLGAPVGSRPSDGVAINHARQPNVSYM